MSKIKEPRGRGKLKDLIFLGWQVQKTDKNKNSKFPSKYFVIVLNSKQTVFVKKFCQIEVSYLECQQTLTNLYLFLFQNLRYW